MIRVIIVSAFLLWLAACTPQADALTFPVSSVPNWGAMTKAEQWEAPYEKMDTATFVPVPKYNKRTFTESMQYLRTHRSNRNNAKMTIKLFYSTRYCSTKNLDSAEGNDPKCEHAAIDLYLTEGMPVH
jgi:hypothetical protein